MRNMRQQILFSLVLTLVVFSGQLFAQQKFVAFGDFLSSTAVAGSASYVGQPGAQVQDASAFQQMQQHILTLYNGVQVSHSFLLGSQYFDCIPIRQQASVRLLGITSIASPPPQPALTDPGDYASAMIGQDEQYDAFGNSTTCEDSTIPMRRVTLDEVTRFATLLDFFSKSPDGDAVQAATHKYAYTRQAVDNLGGNSALNVWKPNVDTSKGQIFSLSQQWFSGGTGAGTQTVEGGWQNYPAKYGDQNSRLFIFWTADNYGNLKCYNLECPAFVQINKSWPIGGKFSNYSIYGGAQYYFTMQWELFQGNWWLGLGNDTKRQWVGYYPGTIFRGGQMSRNAQSITFGGETTGDGNWGPMGSGDWPAKGYKYAAYQRQIYYIDTNSVSQWANLTAYQPSPSCYKVDGPKQAATAIWGIYFFFGGPGGDNCE